jgi:MtrB/PioB family decaheme-associated outer membrane protein
LQLGTDRDRSTFGFNKKFSDSLELSVKYRNEEKKGQRHFGANAGGANNPNFFVEPINSRTHQLDASLNYLSKDLQLQGGYYGSWYKNTNSFLTAINGATTLYVTLPPDNFAHQLFLNGSYAISPSTKATMRLAHTTGIQDDQRLRSDLPAGQVWAGWGGVKAKVVTSEAQLGISSKPMKDLSLLANVHYQDRADKTPVVAYNNQATPDDTTPHSFKSLNAKFEASYRVQPGFKLLGGAYLEIRERSIPYDGLNNAPAVPTNAGANWTVPTVATNEREVPYRSKTEERTLKAQATKSLSDELNGSLALAHSKRDGSSFKWTDQINLVNPLHMANRDRDKVGVKLDWSSSDLVSVQAQFDQAKDDYGRNGLNGDYTAPNGMTLYGTGIRDGSAQLFSVDANIKLSDSWQLTAWYSRDETKATQYSYQANFGTDPIRRANLADTGDSLGIGVKGKATARLLVGADLQWNKSVGKYQQSNFNNQANMVEGLPDITNKTLRLALNGTFQLDKNSSVRVDLIHDRWETNDWTWTMWNNAQTALIPYAYNTDGTSISTKGTQSANFIAVRYKYEF